MPVTLHQIRRLGEYGTVCCIKWGDLQSELHLIRRAAILWKLRDFSWKNVAEIIFLLEEERYR